MPSLVWNLDIQTAYDNPYEYGSQEQFIRESKLILRSFLDELSKYDMKFNNNEQSIQKAIWMLHNDGVHAAYEINFLLSEKRTNIASRIFRDIDEALDLAAYFHSDTKDSNSDLVKWYFDEIVSHSRYRNFIRKKYGEQIEEKIKSKYRSMSKLTHRTYATLKYGYMLGGENFIAYDGYDDEPDFRLPQTVSMYIVLLGEYIKKISDELGKRGLIKTTKIASIWANCLEKETVPRRFTPMSEFLESVKHKKNKEDDL